MPVMSVLLVMSVRQGGCVRQVCQTGRGRVADDRISVRLPDGMREAMRGARGETAEAEYVVQALRAALGTMAEPGGWHAPGAGAVSLPVTHEVPPGGIGSAGVACAWSACWARDTRRYGVTDPAELRRGDYAVRPRDEESCGIPLCPAHAARLAGFRFVSPHLPPRSSAREPA